MRSALSKDGTAITFDQSGQGPALILVGGATSTRRDQAPLAEVLAAQFTVVTYDRRGRGDSGDTLPYAVEREVEDIDALINEAGGSAFVFGHSSGAVLTLEAARLLPAKIMKLAVYEPPFFIDDSRPPAPANFATQLSDLIASGQPGEAVVSFMTLVGMPVQMLNDMRQSPMWPRLEAIAPTLVYDMLVIGDTESGDPLTLRRWATVTVPTLVMDGTVFFGSTEQHAFLRHGAQELAAILPHAHRRTLEGQDHGPAITMLAPALQEFFFG